MKFTVEKGPFFTALQRVQNIVERRTNLPILTNALINAENDEIRISATDLEIALQSRISSKVSVGGSIAIKAKSLIEIIRELPDSVVMFKVDENQRVEILSGTSFFSLLSLPADDFPKIEGFENENKYEFHRINTNVFIDGLDKTLYAASTDTARYHLNSVYFQAKKTDEEKLRLVATDSFRLAVVDLKNFFVNSSSLELFKKGVIIPRKGLYDLRRILSENLEEDIFMTIIGNMIYFKRKDFFISMRLIEGQYADYTRMVPSQFKDAFMVDKDRLLSAIKRVALVSLDKSKSVKLTLTNNLLCVLAQSPELGNAKEEIPIEYSGKEVEAIFNSRFLIETLSVIEDGEKYIIELRGKESPIVFRSLEKDNYVSVIMPIKS